MFFFQNLYNIVSTALQNRNSVVPVSDAIAIASKSNLIDGTADIVITTAEGRIFHVTLREEYVGATRTARDLAETIRNLGPDVDAAEERAEREREMLEMLESGADRCPVRE